MADKIKIDIVSDVVCPWCIVGYKRLSKAISELGIEDQVEIEWQPFELNTKMPVEGQNLREHLTEKYNSTAEQQANSVQQLTDVGADLGFTFDFYDEMRIVNTFESHILLDYARRFNKQTALKMGLISAYFSERKDVSDRDVLKQVLLDVGLDANEALEQLDNELVKNQVRETQNFWKNAGVNSVPTIVFNRKSAVTGAHPVGVFKKVLGEMMN